MKRARIATLHAAAANRPSGYLEACLAAGKISPDGEWVIFRDTAHAALRARFNPRLHAMQSAPRQPRVLKPCPDQRLPCGRSAP